MDYIANENVLNKDELREIAACSLMGLCYLHNRDIIHGVIVIQSAKCLDYQAR